MTMTMTRRGLHYLDLDLPDAPLNLSDRESRADTDGDADDDDDDDILMTI